MTVMEAEQATISVPVIVPIPAETILDLLLGAGIAICTDKSLQVLNAIYLEVADGTLTATATDRYRLITGSTAVDSIVNGNALLPYESVVKVIAALKPLVKWLPGYPVNIEISGTTISFRLPEVSFTFDTLDGMFPANYRKLLDIPTEPSESMRFNATYLGDLAKIPTGSSKRDGKDGVVLTFHGDMKPVTFIVSHPAI